MAVPLLHSQHGLFRRPANEHKPPRETSLVNMVGSETDQQDTHRTTLLWAQRKRRYRRFGRTEKNTPTLPWASYR